MQGAKSAFMQALQHKVNSAVHGLQATVEQVLQVGLIVSTSERTSHKPMLAPHSALPQVHLISA